MKNQFDGQRLRQVRTALGLSQQEMAVNLGLKQGSLSDIECGKTKGLSDAVSILLELVYDINIAYFYYNSDQMFLRAETIAQNEKKITLSQFSIDQVAKYIMNNEKKFRANALFRSYLNAVILNHEAQVAAETYRKIREKELGGRGDKTQGDQNAEKDS